VKDFKEFLLRGNLVETAVGIVIGLAFAAVVSALVADLITPLIAAIFGKQDFGGLTFAINGSVFRYGHFLNALITFVIVAAVVFFLVVKPVNALVNRFKREPVEDPDIQPCPHCLSTIPSSAAVCAYCTRDLLVGGV
jgi:large conductance mechanosensitive channel